MADSLEYPTFGKDRHQARWNTLKSERASWDGHWKQLSQLLLPRNARFVSSDRNRGEKRHNRIYDNTGTRAVRVLAAGMMAGMTSPARPWFRLAIPDPDLMQYDPVKVWLADVTRLMLRIFARSNTYRALHHSYEELGVFGTAATIVQPNFDTVIHHTPLTIGEYAIAENAEGQVDTLYREFQKPVHAVVREFGLDACSATVQSLWKRGSYDNLVTVVHAVEPRLNRDFSSPTAKNMPWASCYFELEGDKGKYLRESGFRRFPGLAPRWAVAGGDVYGNSPGMEVLGDVEQLQHEQLRKANAIDYMTKPPLQAPTSMKGQEVNAFPGGVSFLDTANPNGGIRAAFEVRLNLEHLLMDIQDVRERVRSGFYADLFLMLSQSDNPRMTATEVAERHEEKLLMLGPVLERLHNELLDPLVEMTFDMMIEAGILPPPPPELEGMDLNVEFVSMLAQAQRAVATNSIDRFVGGMGAIAALKPEVLDKFDADEWAESYADMLGVDPKLLVDDDKVEATRQARAEAQAAAQAAEQGAALADAAGKLGGVPMEGGATNAGERIMNNLTGYGSPSAEAF